MGDALAGTQTALSPTTLPAMQALGPTRVYRGETRDGPDIWAFPILHMGKEASLEEMGFDDVPIGAVREWLHGGD